MIRAVIASILGLTLLACSPITIIPSLIERDASWLDLGNAEWQLPWKDSSKQEGDIKCFHA